MNKTKSIFASKTFWFNALAVVVLIANSYFGFSNFELDEIFAGEVLAVVNILLRLITSKGVSLTGS